MMMLSYLKCTMKMIYCAAKSIWIFMRDLASAVALGWISAIPYHIIELTVAPAMNTTETRGASIRKSAGPLSVKMSNNTGVRMKNATGMRRRICHHVILCCVQSLLGCVLKSVFDPIQYG